MGLPQQKCPICFNQLISFHLIYYQTYQQHLKTHQKTRNRCLKCPQAVNRQTETSNKKIIRFLASEKRNLFEVHLFEHFYKVRRSIFWLIFCPQTNRQHPVYNLISEGMMPKKAAVKSVTFVFDEGQIPAEKSALSIPARLDSKTKIEQELIRTPINRPPILARHSVSAKEPERKEEEVSFSIKQQIRMPSKSTISTKNESFKQTQIISKDKRAESDKLEIEDFLKMKRRRYSIRATCSNINMDQKNRLAKKVDLLNEKLMQNMRGFIAVREEKYSILKGIDARALNDTERSHKSEARKA